MTRIYDVVLVESRGGALHGKLRIAVNGYAQHAINKVLRLMDKAERLEVLSVVLVAEGA